MPNFVPCSFNPLILVHERLIELSISSRSEQWNLLIFFIEYLNAKPSTRKNISNKTNVYNIDDTWSLDILHLKDLRFRKKTCYRCVW